MKINIWLYAHIYIFRIQNTVKKHGGKRVTETENKKFDKTQRKTVGSDGWKKQAKWSPICDRTDNVTNEREMK